MTSLVATVLAAGLCGCAPDPFADPTPPPTPSGMVSGFASDEEAFAAAEATYRAYVDAVNDVVIADSDTYKPVFEWLTGEALRSSRESLDSLRSRRLRVEGQTSVARIELRQMRSGAPIISVCLDVSDVELLDTKGESVVATSRPDVQALTVGMVPSATATGLSIATSDTAEALTCQ